MAIDYRWYDAEERKAKMAAKVNALLETYKSVEIPHGRHGVVCMVKATQARCLPAAKGRMLAKLIYEIETFMRTSDLRDRDYLLCAWARG